MARRAKTHPDFLASCLNQFAHPIHAQISPPQWLQFRRHWHGWPQNPAVERELLSDAWPAFWLSPQRSETTRQSRLVARIH
jgi:hypothetical protein